MPSLNTICNAMATVIANNTELTVHTYGAPGDIVDYPAIVVEPDDGDYGVSMADSTTWILRIYVLCSTANMAQATRNLNDLIDGWGPNSVRQIIRDHSDLNLNSTDSFATGLAGYSGSFDSAGLPAIGAIVSVRVTTDSRAA